MADLLTWPSVLEPSSEDWSLRGGTRSGGQTFQGQEQIVVSPTARWKASLSIPCYEREHVLAMRQLIALGRAQQWLVGPYEVPRAPWNIDIIGGPITYAAAAKSPGTYIGDQSAALDFRLSEDAAVNATTLLIQRYRGGLIEPGMFLQISDRLHLVVALPYGELTTPGQEGPPGIVPIEIRPWLRTNYSAGTPIEFGSPVGRMRLATDDTGAMELQLSRYGTVNLDLVEAL